MAKCVIIGKDFNAKEIENTLNSVDVPTLSIRHNLGIVNIVAACKREKDLKVIAVCCADCGTGGIPLLVALKKAFNGEVLLHAIVEGNEDSAENELLTDSGAHDTFFQIPLKPFDAAKNIKLRWFSMPKTTEASAKKVTATRVVRPLDGDKISKPNDTISRLAKLAIVPAPHTPAVISTSAVVKSQKSPSVENTATREIPSILEMLMQRTRRNDPLPEKAKVMSIVGMNGKVVQLDPRRIRPLPENPRGEDNPGFSEASLRELGIQVKTFGQTDEAMVCPVVDDPNYDAQLVDGERRQRSAMLTKVMLWVTVREDITPKEVSKLYLMAVVRNLQKEKPTTREYIRIVSNLRGPEFQMTIQKVAETIGSSTTHVSHLEMLGKLDHQVQNMLVDARTEAGGTTATKGYVFTSQLALLLVDVELKDQRAVAEEIRAKKMNYGTARRYVLNIRRGLGLTRTPDGMKRQTRQFDSLATLIRRSIDQFGVFGDIPTAEFAPIIRSRKPGERSGVSQDLRSLIENLNDLAEKIDRLGAAE